MNEKCHNSASVSIPSTTLTYVFIHIQTYTHKTQTNTLTKADLERFDILFAYLFVLEVKTTKPILNYYKT